MFLNKYINEFYLNLIYDNYEEDFINSLDEENFIKISNLFKNNNFYFINDIYLNYLEIFNLDYEEVFNKLEILKNKLGNNYNYIIGNDMRYLEFLIN